MDGICGRSYGKIRGCINNCTITGNNSIGGIVGQNFGNIERCTNNGKIEGGGTVGGICGNSSLNDGELISECINNGMLVYNSSAEGNSAGYFGGITGHCYGSVYKCGNYGAINGGYGVGGIVGIMDDRMKNDPFIKLCWNKRKINYKS